jgi:hypothetical protein
MSGAWRRANRPAARPTLERVAATSSMYAPEVSTNSADTASATPLAPSQRLPSQSSAVQKGSVISRCVSAPAGTVQAAPS